jgi:2-hydroxy-3-keto-5-methylthiopentenyl-1-phosphate phosphatase
MEPLIRAVLSKLIGEEAAAQMEIVANGVKVEGDGRWEIEFRHPER